MIVARPIIMQTIDRLFAGASLQEMLVAPIIQPTRHNIIIHRTFDRTVQIPTHCSGYPTDTL